MLFLKQKNLKNIIRHNVICIMIKIKDYPGDIGQQSLKKELQQVQYEMSQNSFIQNYYQAYDQLNDLLEEVTCIVFKSISDDLQIERFQL